MPDDTIITVYVMRRYSEKDNKGIYSFDYFSDINSTAKLWKTKRKIKIDNKQWLAKLKLYTDGLKKKGIFNGLKQIDKELIVEFSVDAGDQPQNIYEELNRNLEGSMVIGHGVDSAKVIRWEKKINYPIK